MEYFAGIDVSLEARAGSICLNSFGRFAKWISASIMGSEQDLFKILR